MRQCRCYVEVNRRIKDRRSKNCNLLRLVYKLYSDEVNVRRSKFSVRRSKSTDVRTTIFDVNEKYSIAIPGMTSSFVFTASFTSSDIYTQKMQNLLRRLLRRCRFSTSFRRSKSAWNLLRLSIKIYFVVSKWPYLRSRSKSVEVNCEIYFVVNP